MEYITTDMNARTTARCGSTHAAAPQTHEKVYQLLRERIDIRGRRILDLPCGAGAFSARLLADGAEVVSVDIERSESLLVPAERLVLHDANLTFPFADSEFDAVVSIEGIEHIENPFHFLRECRRVLKDGGYLIVTTPNADSFASRMKVFTRGYHKFFKPVGLGDKASGHQLAIDAVYFRGAATRTGLEVVDVSTNRATGKSWLTELFRPYLTAKLPGELREGKLFYGEVAIYVLKKPA
ncbi:MAG: class I SAM-dependent methyltransferase [Gammaproteobacteria bacterium]